MTLHVYNPTDWFWIVGSDGSRAWSSAAADWVTEWPVDRISRIANDVELYDVLARAYPLGKPSRLFSPQEVLAALVAIDTGKVAHAFGGSVPESVGTTQDVINLQAAAAAMQVSIPTMTVAA